jgi:cytochrome c oxidase subunit 2
MKTLRVVFAGLVVIAVASLQAAAQTTPSEIKVTAKKYEFKPSAIKVKQGDHVRLVVTALDHDHGFKLEAFNIDQLLKKGEAVTIEFTADKAGTFPFECSHFCGLGHKRMKGELVVE